MIKKAHTVVWAFFAGCVVTIPILAATGPRFVAGPLVLLCQPLA